MPHEIADSDEEADFPEHFVLDHNETSMEAEQSPSTKEATERDPVLDAEFDQFLSPTQRISQFDNNNHENDVQIATSVRLDSSTNRFLRDIAPASPSPQTSTAAAEANDCGEVGMGGKRNHQAQEEKTASKKRSRMLSDESAHSTEGSSGKARKRVRTNRSSSPCDGV